MRIAYWNTSPLEPEVEAVSREVFSLAGAFPGSWILGFNPHLGLRFSPRKRCVGIGSRHYALARVLFPLLARRFDLHHVYGDLTPWIFHKTLRRGPMVHTVTQAVSGPESSFLQRCDAVVAQVPSVRDVVLRAGVHPAKVHLRLPGLDLSRYAPVDAQRAPSPEPRILFATAPRAAEEMAGRGVNLLVEAAARAADLGFRFLYRTWRTGYTSLEATRRLIATSGVRNIELTDGVVRSMQEAYQAADLTVIPFTTADGGKECPNSALESLACGVPVIISRACPFAAFVEEHRCGVAFDPGADALVEAARTALSRWSELSRAARAAAEAHLDWKATVAFYQQLYTTLLDAKR